MDSVQGFPEPGDVWRVMPHVVEGDDRPVWLKMLRAVVPLPWGTPMVLNSRPDVGGSARLGPKLRE